MSVHKPIHEAAHRSRGRVPTMVLALMTAVTWTMAGCHARRQPPVEEVVTAAGLALDYEIDQVLANPKHMRATARRMVEHRQHEEAVTRLLQRLQDGRDTAPIADIRTSVELYLLLPNVDVARLFQNLIGSRRLEVRRTAWQVASSHPSATMAEAVRRELGRRAALGPSTGLSPEAALAAKMNGLSEAYPLLRTTLMQEPHVAYVNAMIVLGPESVADDLLVFLATIAPEELQSRQPLPLPLRNACLAALRHFDQYPPSLHHPNLGHLFHVATASDPVLSEAGLAQVAKLMARHTDHFAFLLTQSPHDLQQAFLERLGRYDDVLYGRFAAALGGFTPGVF